MNRLSLAIRKFEQAIQIIFGRGFPPGSLCTVDCNGFLNEPKSGNHFSSLKEIFDNGFLWAVPKKRRTLEARYNRRFGVEKYIWKPPIAKTNILLCVNCGHHYEAGRLCALAVNFRTQPWIRPIQFEFWSQNAKPLTQKIQFDGFAFWLQSSNWIGHCYEKVKLETKEMQDAIQKKLGLSPVEQNVIVLYDGEKDSKTHDFWKNQRIVEMPKKRPSWFHQNLLEPTSQEPSDRKDVKPTNLS